MGSRPGYHTPLESASSISAVQEILAGRAKTMSRGAWITTIGGFHRNQFLTPGENPHLPFLALHSEKKLPARLRINLLHQDTTPDLPTLTERLKNS